MAREAHRIHLEEVVVESFFFHPRVVHLPMALSALMPLLAGGFLIAWLRGWQPARGWWLVVGLQAILFVSCVAALNSGESDEPKAAAYVAAQHLEHHEQAAQRFAWASGVVLVLMLIAGAMGKGLGALPTASVATLGTVLVLGLGVHAGKAGGELVYRHGAARAWVEAAAAE